MLSYLVPPSLDSIASGDVVWVTLRGKPAVGVVIRLHDDAPDLTLLPVLGAIDPPLTIPSQQMAAAQWMAREYACSRYEALALFLPPGVTQRAEPFLKLADPPRQAGTFTPLQQRVLDLLAARGEISLAAAQKALGSSLASAVPALTEAGAIERSFRLKGHRPGARQERWVRIGPEVRPDAPGLGTQQRVIVDLLERRRRLRRDEDDGFVRAADVLSQTGAPRESLNSLIRNGVVEETVQPVAGRLQRQPRGETIPALTPAQATAWAAIEASLHAGTYGPYLLYGVTGSGKTEIYLRAAAWCLRHGKSALILVPEIALSSQVANRFTERFDDQVAVLHSGLSDSERYAAWQGIAAGHHPIVVGPRSALFAPVEEIGLIVLDEEHDAAYKQDSTPRYHARATAEVLARQAGAVVLFGSATPAVETFWRAERGEIDLIRLPERIGPGLRSADGSRGDTILDLPQVDIVDMRLELHRGNTSLLSAPLRELLTGTLSRREQAILLLNRRGMATVVLCRACGLTLSCPYCDIPLVYHQDRERLICHRCDYREGPRRGCPNCGGPLDYFGAGTQRVEAEVRRQFPQARVLRWDQDTVRRLGGPERLLRQVELGEVDLIVGTQMVAKGFDLPRVTAIGVINADTGLHLPDFRSGERTFSLLTQVAGRAGRRGPGSRVIVQSYTPEHYAIQAASRHDYEGFYAEEIDFRRDHRYPPFVRLVRYLHRARDDANCAAAADTMARKLARHARDHGVAMDLLGPAPAFVSRVRGEYQWQVVLRTGDLEALLDGLPADPGWIVDVDPQSML